VLAPPVSSQAAPKHDQVTGTGTAGEFGDPQLHVNAIQAPTGAKGGFTIRYPAGTTVTGRVSCLTVTGTVAFVTGVITESSGLLVARNNWAPGNYLVIGVADNGEPGTAGPDRLNFSAGLPVDPNCGRNDLAIPTIKIVAGNFQVFDARN
jgi:hypothetical protein